MHAMEGVSQVWQTVLDRVRIIFLRRANHKESRGEWVWGNQWERACIQALKPAWIRILRLCQNRPGKPEQKGVEGT